MEGSMMDRWIERLVPVFDGRHALGELTDGLPEAHRTRVYEIAETLRQNGFVRDVSLDAPHRLPENVTARYAAQIEFLDALGGSGAYRFERMREARVLAAGSGAFLLSLAAGLLEAGLPRFDVLMTSGKPDERRRLAEIEADAGRNDPDVRIEAASAPEDRSVDWGAALRPYEWVLFVSSEQNADDELRRLNEAARELGTKLLPAVIYGQKGVAGPLVAPGSSACWESARRRLHRAAVTADAALHAPSSTAESLLANVIVFEWFKAASGVGSPDLDGAVHLMNLETLESGRHAFLPHPAAPAGTERAPGADEAKEPEGWFAFFHRLATPDTGIFRSWDEGDRIQLPLSQCAVVPIDPWTDGPADNLPEIVCGAMTHEEARRESGLAGIEAYLESWHRPAPGTAVGAGETKAEAVCRALFKLAADRLRGEVAGRPPVILRIQPESVEDHRFQYYLTSLKVMGVQPNLGTGGAVHGLPTAWAGVHGRWYGCAGADRTLALRGALRQALLDVQNGQTAGEAYVIVPAWEESGHEETLERATALLRRNGVRVDASELETEPFVKQSLAGAFAVSLEREVSS